MSEEMQVRKLGYWMPVNVVSGVPLCTHGDPMIETSPGEWMCPDGAAALDALRPAIARLDAQFLGYLDEFMAENDAALRRLAQT